MKSLRVIGLNSGTSMDGVDAALFKISPAGNGAAKVVPDLKVELLESALIPFDPLFQRKLKRLIGRTSASLEEVCLMNTALGEVFADAAMQLLKKSKEKADLIGSHGQTIWHSPRPKAFWGVTSSGTLQLGEPSVIAARTGLPVVADFRTSDVAFGGEGAPLVSFADEVLFGKQGIASGILNIGGIANITIIDSKGEAVMAFDTGPGNMLMDRAAETLFGRELDEGGKLAAAGKVNEKWLSELLSHPYMAQKPPKTTGRELFGNNTADKLIEEAQKVHKIENPNDIIATLTAFTARSIALNYKEHVAPTVTIERLILGGGGAQNPELVSMISKAWPHKISIFNHEDFGISTKFKESLLFALLAYTSFFSIPNNVPSCTGASRRVCLGKLIRP